VEFRAASQTCERTTPVPPLRVVVFAVVVLNKLITMNMSRDAAPVNQGIASSRCLWS